MVQPSVPFGGTPLFFLRARRLVHREEAPRDAREAFAVQGSPCPVLLPRRLLDPRPPPFARQQNADHHFIVRAGCS